MDRKCNGIVDPDQGFACKVAAGLRFETPGRRLAVAGLKLRDLGAAADSRRRVGALV